MDIDTEGNSLSHQVNRKVESKFKEFYKKFGIPREFKYTDINA